MRITVLGSSGTYPRPGEACNGFLIQESGANIVVDFGTGCMANLLNTVDFTRLDAVIISHMHVDHYLDLYPLFYALRFHLDKPWGLPLYAPRGGLETMGRVLGEDSRAYLDRVFTPFELRDGESVPVGPLQVHCYPASHPVEAFCLRLEAAEGPVRILGYSGDTAPCPGLVEAARGVDLFLCEATMINSFAEHAHGHMTSRGAGETASEAGAARLVLTHIWPTFDREQSRREAAEAYEGPLAVALQGMILDV